LVSGALFSILAYAHPVKRGGFVGATIGCLSILPFTTVYMIPIVNNKLLAFDDKAEARKTEEVEVKRLQVSELLERIRHRILVRGGLFWAILGWRSYCAIQPTTLITLVVYTCHHVSIYYVSSRQYVHHQ